MFPPHQDYQCELRSELFRTFIPQYDIRTILELGRNTGWCSTYWFVESGAEVWSVDISDSNFKAGFLGQYPKYHHIVADTLQPIPEIDDKKFDLIYLDTSHTYEATKFEITKYCPMALKWFIVDDYNADWEEKSSWIRVRRACNESGYKFEPIGGTIISPNTDAVDAKHYKAHDGNYPQVRYDDKGRYHSPNWFYGVRKCQLRLK